MLPAVSRLVSGQAAPRLDLDHERGSVLVLVGASLLVFMLCAAFVVDVGNARQVARNYQNAADGAALAGAQELNSGQAGAGNAILLAAKYAFQGLGTSAPEQSGCQGAPSGEAPSPSAVCYEAQGVRVYITTPWNDPVANGVVLPGGNEPRQVNVKVCGEVVAGFSRIVGINFIKPCRVATAMSGLGTGPCAMCVLGGFSLAGNGTATVTGSSAWINGNATYSSGTFSAPEGFFVGGTADPGFTPPPNSVDAPAISDPLDWLPGAMQRQPNWAPPYLPDRLSFTFDPTGGLNQSIDPGIWNNIRVNAGTSNHTLTLNPGFYVVRGRFEILGNVNVVGNGVTIYFACNNYWQNPCDPGPGAYFDHQGGGSVTLSATTTPGDPYQNLLFFFDRNNQTDPNQVLNKPNRFSGSANVTGTIYAKSAQFVLGGGNFNSLFVVDSMHLSGNGLLNIMYNPSEQVPIFLPALIT